MRVGISSSNEGVGNGGQPLAGVGSVNDHEDYDENEELGADETNELVGQLIDYVSDLTLQS